MSENSQPTADPPDDLNPFDPARLKLSQDFAANVGVKKALITVPVRKPDRQTFVRVHPDPDYRLETAVLELKDERETYLVAPGLWPELPGEVTPKVLLTAVSRQGVTFLWPIRLPDSDGRLDEWSRSALEAASRAENHWVKLVGNRSLGAYEVYDATGKLPDPEWPEVSFQELLRIAFKDRFIESLDHSVIKRLQGQI